MPRVSIMERRMGKRRVGPGAGPRDDLTVSLRGKPKGRPRVGIGGRHMG